MLAAAPPPPPPPLPRTQEAEALTAQFEDKKIREEAVRIPDRMGYLMGNPFPRTTRTRSKSPPDGYTPPERRGWSFYCGMNVEKPKPPGQETKTER